MNLSEKTVKILAWSVSKIAKFACDGVSLVSVWSGVKSRDTHLAEIFDISYSLCRIFSTGSREIPTLLAIWAQLFKASLV